jgi:hypothetical protein
MAQDGEVEGFTLKNSHCLYSVAADYARLGFGEYCGSCRKQPEVISR